MKRYNSINGLRAISALGIVLMHILVNGKYIINDTANSVIMFLTEFVLLFLIISGFSMCCGYYEKLKEGKITLNDFYKKRFAKIWPFFAIVVVLAVIVEHTWTGVIEGVTELTLSYGLLPNNTLSIVGVGWTLGVIFLFYMLFPFFVFLLDNKKRAWLSFIITIILNMFCIVYFFNGNFVVEGFTARHSFLFCSMFFMQGGMIYLYKDSITKIISKHKIIYGILILAITIGLIWLSVPGVLVPFKLMLLFAIWLMYAISLDNSKILDNKVTKFLSDMSLELYLSHMVCFRLVEKLKLDHLIKGNDALSYIIAVGTTLVIAIVFILVCKKIIEIIKNRTRTI